MLAQERGARCCHDERFMKGYAVEKIVLELKFRSIYDGQTRTM